MSATEILDDPNDTERRISATIYIHGPPKTVLGLNHVRMNVGNAQLFLRTLIDDKIVVGKLVDAVVPTSSFDDFQIEKSDVGCRKSGAISFYKLIFRIGLLANGADISIGTMPQFISHTPCHNVGAGV